MPGSRLLPLACALVFATSADAAAPHIVLIVAEDLSPRVGAFGDPVARTPHLDQLAREGVRYPNTFTTAGVCAPSRAALITGVHQIALGAQHMRTSSRPAGSYQAVPPPEVKAFPEQLRAASYYTLVNEKLDYQFSGPLTGSGPFTIWDAEGSDESWRDRPAGTPFFAMFNLQETHESGVFLPLGHWPHSAMQLVMQLVRAWQFGLDDGEGETTPSEVAVPPYYPDTPTVRSDLARHYNNIQRMDAHVGRILAELEADGLADSTIVVWTTDHGDGLPRAKRELYDSGIRVPMIIRWPEALRPEGLAPGDVDPRLVSFVDLAPTILAWAGAERPEALTGQDFTDPSTPPRPYVYASRDRIDEVADRQRAVRDERFKYIRSWHPEVPGGHPLAFRDNLAMMQELHTLRGSGELEPDALRWFEPPGRERLYDTQSDPHELHDLAGDPSFEADLARLRAALDQWLARTQDWSDVPEDEMVSRFWPSGEQPETPAPRVEIVGDRVELSATTPGASLGYRLDEGPWQLYAAPIPAAGASRLEARAQRYGWAPSPITRLVLPSQSPSPDAH